MIGPACKRGAASHLQRGLEMSQRRACEVVGQARATQRYVPEAEAEEERLRARLGTSEHGSQRRVATRPNQVRSYDFVSDQTSDGPQLRYLCVVDEFTREGLALEVRRRFPAAAVQAWLKNQGVGPLSIAPVGAPPLPAHASAETQQP